MAGAKVAKVTPINQGAALELSEIAGDEFVALDNGCMDIDNVRLALRTFNRRHLSEEEVEKFMALCDRVLWSISIDLGQARNKFVLFAESRKAS